MNDEGLDLIDQQSIRSLKSKIHIERQTYVVT